ncbi:MAG TPA: OmpA family protein [Pseudonocardia sp.]|nr:OmpA family protein [Pseudonocardia sp.]
MTHPTSRGTARVGWVGALVTVPLLLAGLATVWPGPQLSAGLRAAAETALTEAGLDGVTVRMDGRDAELRGVPAGAEAAASGAVAAVPGVRTVAILAGPSDTADAPVTPAPPPPDPDEGPRLAEQVEALLDTAPIRFRPDSAELTGPARETVRRLAELLRGAPGAQVVVEGHAADAPGPEEVAQRLSEARATAVEAALVEDGVAPERVSARGLGASRPLATRDASRRVEIETG